MTNPQKKKKKKTIFIATSVWVHQFLIEFLDHFGVFGNDPLRSRLATHCAHSASTTG